MNDTDDFDTDIDTAPEENVNDEQDVSEVMPVKSGGGFLFKFIVILIALGGGGFFAVKQMGIAIPGLTPPATAQALPDSIKAAQNEQPTTVSAEDALSTPPVSPAQAQHADAPAAMPTTAAVMSPASAQNPAAETTQDPMAGLDMPEMPQNAAAAPENTTTESAETPADISQPEAMQSAAAPEESAAMTIDAPLPQDAAAQESALPAPVVIVAPEESQAPDMPAGQNTAQESALPAPVAAVSAGTDDFNIRIGQLEEKMSVLEGKLSDIESNLASKSDIEDIKQALQDLQGVAEKKKDADALKEARREVDDYRHGKMPKTVKVYSKTHKEKAPAAAFAPSTATNAYTQPVPAWVLKSAKPGQAWLMKKASGEMVTVSVGDSLKGIGRVTAIAQDSGGRWVVVGTGGRINQ